MGIKWETSFHKVATVLATALCVLVSILALIFLFDGLANPQGQYAAINYVFAIVGVGFSSLGGLGIGARLLQGQHIFG